MKYLELSDALKKNKLFIFSLKDAQNLFPREKLKILKNNLGRWVKTGRFLRLRKNLYEFIEPGLTSSIPDVYVANKLYLPSYISLETALSIYNLIPGVAAQLTSMTTRPTREFRNKYGWFFYRSCQRRAFTGYKLMQYEGVRVLIADIEKALVDYIYFAVRGADCLDFDAERFNKDSLKKISWGKATKYAKLFNNKTLLTIKRLKEWTRC